jgi:hypothetical protein
MLLALGADPDPALTLPMIEPLLTRISEPVVLNTLLPAAVEIIPPALFVTLSEAPFSAITAPVPVFAIVPELVKLA